MMRKESLENQTLTDIESKKGQRKAVSSLSHFCKWMEEWGKNTNIAKNYKEQEIMKSYDHLHAEGTQPIEKN